MVAHFAPVLVLTPKGGGFGINMTTCCPQRGGASASTFSVAVLCKRASTKTGMFYITIYYIYTTCIHFFNGDKILIPVI